jgi:hypothetical protein
VTVALNPLSAPPPVLVTETVWAVGLAPPVLAKKFRLVGDRLITGEDEVSTMVTFALLKSAVKLYKGLPYGIG